MKLLKCIFKDKGFKVCILVILIQQLLVATGTYLMGDLAANAPTGGLSIVKILILAASLILSGSVFHFLMKYYLTVAEKGVLWQYFYEYSRNNYSRPDLWKNSQAKNERHDVVTREGQDSITQSVQFAADSVATVLNIIFNTISVVLVTNIMVGLAIFGAGIIGLLLIHLNDKKITQSAQNEMTSKTEENAFLGKSWDNIILGNKSAFDRWFKNFTILFENSKAASLHNNKVNDGVVGLAALLTSSIVVGTIFGLMYMNQHQISKVTALLIMLPRSMQIVMHIQVIQSYWAHWKYLLQRLEITEKSTLQAPIQNIDQFINSNKIQLTSEEKTISFDELISSIKSGSGRVTITGENGSGKSTLLLIIKNILKDEGLFIPAQHQLELSENTFAKSSGEVAIQALEDAGRDNARVILLDEWDANLSKENQSKFHRHIENISNKKLVIEIRHHIPGS